MGDDHGDHSCCTGLGLGIGLGEYVPKLDHSQEKKVVSLELSFPDQYPNEEVVDIDDKKENKRSIDNDNDNDNDNKNSSRKKLRLSKEQSALLEESFDLHNTLNSNQKQTLAEKLNLRPRQVEVWFQNRRARTKLKQTEVDCENMKKCCENLSKENHRLKKELQELLELKLRPFYIQLPKAASSLTLCPSCSCDKATSTNLQKNNIKDEKEEAKDMDVV